MDSSLSISSMVAKAVSLGIPNPEPKRRRDRASREAEQRVLRILASRNPEDDSDFEDHCMSDRVWQKMHKHEEQEFDQQIFNVFRQDKIHTQKRKVNITTAICIRNCPEKAREIAMWTKHAKPVLSKAPRKRKIVDEEKAKRDEELNRILAEAAEDIEIYVPSIETPSEMSMEADLAKGAKKKKGMPKN